MKISAQNKEKEIGIIQELIEKQKAAFNAYIAELKQKLQNTGVTDIPSIQEITLKTVPPILQQDNREQENENNRLRSEIMELKTRYNILALQMQLKQ